MKNLIMISNGSMLDLSDTTKCEYEIEEVAHALSGIARFNAHTKEHYSVAQHCSIMSWLVPRPYAYAALMHDMQEAFVSDLPTPIKNMIGPGYRELEDRIQLEMADKFHVAAWKLSSKEVKKADLKMLATERRDLFDNQSSVWPVLVGVDPYEDKIEPLSQEDAYLQFLDNFYLFA